jgi:hypothetical protein
VQFVVDPSWDEGTSARDAVSAWFIDPEDDGTYLEFEPMVLSPRTTLESILQESSSESGVIVTLPDGGRVARYDYRPGPSFTESGGMKIRTKRIWVSIRDTPTGRRGAMATFTTDSVRFDAKVPFIEPFGETIQAV